MKDGKTQSKKFIEKNRFLYIKNLGNYHIVNELMVLKDVVDVDINI